MSGSSDSEIFIISSKTKQVLKKDETIRGEENLILNNYSEVLRVCNCLVKYQIVPPSASSSEETNDCNTLFILKSNNEIAIELNTQWCCNYIIGMNENFIRVDPIITPLNSEEKEEESQLVNSTRIESGHFLMC